MNIRNPYMNKNIIPIESDMFFGRKEEMNSIESMLSSDNPQCVSIVGERRIGKSSLAYRVFHRMKRSENAISVFLDCNRLPESLSFEDDFFRSMNKDFLRAIKGNPKVNKYGIDESNLFDDYSSFDRFIESKHRDLKVIIFLDEFEHLPEKGFADNTFFSNLRALADNPAYKLAFVTVSKGSLENLTHKSIQSSVFWNIFDTRTIGLLDDTSIDKLRRHGFNKHNLSIEEDELELINRYSGNYPFLNQIACGYIFDAKVFYSEIDEDSLETKLSSYYNELWNNRTKEERKLLKKLVDIVIKENSSLQEMKMRGILIKQDETYYPFSDFFAKKIREDFKIKGKGITYKGLKSEVKDILNTAKDALKVISDAKKIVRKD